MPTIVKRGDVWTARVAIDPDPVTGKRRQRRVTGPTKRAVEDMVTRLQHERRSGAYFEPSREPLADYLARWLAALDVRPASRMRYQTIIDCHIAPALGRVPLAHLSAPMVARFYAELREAGMGAVTLGQLHTMFRQALKQAIAWKLLAENPLDGVPRPATKRVRQPVWTLAEARRFLDATAGDAVTGCLWRLLAETGLRRNEALALDWGHVDLTAGTLRVEQALTKTPDGWVVGEPKSDAGRRTVALSPALVTALSGHQEAQEARKAASGVFWRGGAVVFDRGDGERWQPTAVTERFRRAVEKHGMPHGTIHGLRRLSGRMMVVGRVPIKVAQERLGHARASLTLDLYASVEAELQTDAARVIGDLLTGPSVHSPRADFRPRDQIQPSPSEKGRKSA